LILASLLALSGLVLRAAGEFAFLIDYERGNYADRLFILAGLILLLPALAGLAAWVERGLRGRATAMATILLFLAAWQAAAVYDALPRHDAAAISRGWSVGRADQEAVRWIERDAAGQTYTVLADQAVSAAAVEAFSFKRYAGEVFYYPIPTGGPLYQLFLIAASGTSTRATVKQAAQLGQSNLVYVVLNDYWWNFDQVNEELTAQADKSQIIEDGKAIIFRFNF
jgi:hypothetical protein